MTKRFSIFAVALAVGGLGGAAYEISAADATDEHVVHAPVRSVVIDAEGGDVRLDPRADAGVQVRVHRDHLVNTPSTSERVADGVLTLETDCAVGFLPCASDYRVAVPAGVTVTVDKPSGRLDARALGGGLVELDGDAVTVTAPAG